MKKFSDFTRKPVRRIVEQDETSTQQEEPIKANLPENIGGSEAKPEEQTTDTQETGGDSTCSKFFSKLFESREMSHIYHLQVKGDSGSHATHTALGEYYDGVLDLIDSLIETYQGQYGIIEEYDVIDTKETKSRDVVEYFNLLATFIKENKSCINTEDTHLHNIVDEVVALVYRTLYKLKYTK